MPKNSEAVANAIKFLLVLAVIALAIVAKIAASHVDTDSGLPPCDPIIKLTSPTNGSTIPRQTNVTGNVSCTDPTQHLHLYVIVEYGDKCWPQSNELNPEYSRTNKTYEFFVNNISIGNGNDTGQTFIIEAVLVTNDSVHKHFKDWFRDGNWSNPIPIAEIQQEQIITRANVSVVR